MTYDPSYGNDPLYGSAPTVVGEQPSRTEQVTDSAKEQGRHTAAVATDEVKNVAAEVTNQARDLLAELRTQVGEQSGVQKQRLVEVLGTFTDELKQMAEAGGGSGTATELVRQLASRTQSLRDQLDGHEPTQLLDQGRGVARRRPGAFLLGALVAGVAAGRLTRGAKAASSSGTETAAPLYGTTQPPVTTTYTPAGVTPAYDQPAYDQPTFEPSVYEPGHSNVADVPGPSVTPGQTQRPYGGAAL